ncbi:MAG: hypothetical protein KF729_32520 [Sandaracinaceae bacterium]|nr:hypothetical protein [Sandaracinaceae bacterium]
MRALTIAALVLVSACDGSGPADAGMDASADAGGDASAAARCEGPPDATAGAGGITRGCAQGVVSSGFGIRLDGPALPLARWGASLRLEAPDLCGLGRVLSGVTLLTDVDPRTPGAHARASYHVLGEAPVGSRLDAGTDAPPIRIARGRAIVEPTAEAPRAETLALFDLAAAGLDDAATIVVVLDGVEVDLDVPQDLDYPPDYRPADGYALAALGASFGPETREAGTLRFMVRARLELGRSGETAMDRAAAVARGRVIVRYAVVALDRAPATQTVAYEGECRPGPEVGAIALDVPPGDRAVPALSWFEWELGEGAAGAFVRELAVMVEDFAHEPATGRASMRVEGFVEGARAEVLPQRFSAEVALLTWSGGDDAVAFRALRAVETRRAETPLPIAP